MYLSAYPKIISEAPEKSGVEAFARIFPVPFRNFGICARGENRENRFAPWPLQKAADYGIIIVACKDLACIQSSALAKRDFLFAHNNHWSNALTHKRLAHIPKF
jgi:hypothetical protein